MYVYTKAFNGTNIIKCYLQPGLDDYYFADNKNPTKTFLFKICPNIYPFEDYNIKKYSQTYVYTNVTDFSIIYLCGKTLIYSYIVCFLYYKNVYMDKMINAFTAYNSFFIFYRKNL